MQLLARLGPPPSSVWLFGSRANGRATPKSDTDLMIFANRALVESLRRSLPSKPRYVDVLVVIDGDTIIYPWAPSEGSLRQWRWRSVSDLVALYEGTKWVRDPEDDEGELGGSLGRPDSAPFEDAVLELGQGHLLKERAIRLFPCPSVDPQT
jgi:Nucleotidyltransferase domain